MKQANDIVIVSGVRTAIGTMGGSFANTHQHDLGALVIREAVKRGADCAGWRGLRPHDGQAGRPVQAVSGLALSPKFRPAAPE